MGYLLSLHDTFQSTNPPAYGSTEFIEHQSSFLVSLKDEVNQEERQKLRDGEIQDLTRLINAWKNTPGRERAKAIIGGLVCFAAAVVLAIIAYHAFFVAFPLVAASRAGALILLSTPFGISLMAGTLSAIIGFEFAIWAVCSTKRTIAYLEKIKKRLEDEVPHVDVRIAALKQLAEERLEQLSEEQTAYRAALALGRRDPPAPYQRVLMSFMETCSNELMRIRAALSRLGIAIPDAYAQQPVTG